MIIYYQAADPVEIEAMLQEDLILVQNWMRINKLFLNINETKVVLFDYTRNKYDPLHLVLEGIPIVQVSVYKCLGILLDDRLNMKQHINKLCSKSKMTLDMLGHIRLHISKSTAITLYMSLLLLVIEYRDLIYGIANLSNMERLQKPQNFAMHIILLARKTGVSFTNLSGWVLGHILSQPNGSQLRNRGSPSPKQWVPDFK